MRGSKMKIATWNINGIRTPAQALKIVLDSLESDIICIQETKITRDMLDSKIAVVDGYSAYFSFSRKRGGYSGVVTYCKEGVCPVAAEEGLSNYWSSQSATPSDSTDRVGNYGNLSDLAPKELFDLDGEGRAIITEHKFVSQSGTPSSFCVINVYCPRAEMDNLERRQYKINFCRCLQTRAEALCAAGKHVIIVGDLNISHRVIDTCDPSDPEFAINPARLWFSQFLCDKKDLRDSSKTAQKFMDVFRYFHPDEREAFTCWSTATGARANNYGARIDYIIADAGFIKDYFKECRIRPDINGSDHCPVIGEIDVQVIAAEKCPSLCAKWMPEFSGKQKTMMDFVRKRAAVEVTIVRDEEEPSSVTRKRLRLEDTLKATPSSATTKKLTVKPTGKAASGKKNVLNKAEGKPGVQMSLTSFFTKKTSAEPTKPEQALEIRDKRPHLTCVSSSDEIIEIDVSPVSCHRSSSGISETESPVSPSCESASSVDPSEVIEDSQTSSGSQSTKSSVDQWKNLLKGPPPPPLCTGHQEPCVLKLVKKAGPNRGRKFYMCARPEGYKNDPNARCKYFKWTNL